MVDNLLYLKIQDQDNKMAANGISTLTLKRTRQDTKLAKAEAKRQGKVVS